MHNFLTKITATQKSLLLQLIAFWNIWLWYFNRIFDNTGEFWSILALITVLTFIFTEKKVEVTSINTKAIIFLNLLYLVSYNFLPDLLKASLAFILIAILFIKNFNLALISLFLLALPIISSLQFYLGYPLRVLVSTVVSKMLLLNGIFTVREGSCLKFGENTVCVDMPCSGIQMLWTGFYLCFTIAYLYKLNNLKTLLLAFSSLILIIIANIFRASSLFFMESKIITLPEFAHTGIGLICFMLLALLIITVANFLAKNNLELKLAFIREKTTINSFISPKTIFSPTIIILQILVLLIPLTKINTVEKSTLTLEPQFKTFQGKTLKPLPLSSLEEKFSNNFPGSIGRFTDGEKQIIVRSIEKETRKLHPASDCFKAIGYKIKPLPVFIDLDKKAWSRFEAKKEQETNIIYERIYDEHGNSWTDVSAWYWSAFLGETKPNWIDITYSEKV